MENLGFSSSRISQSISRILGKFVPVSESTPYMPNFGKEIPHLSSKAHALILGAPSKIKRIEIHLVQGSISGCSGFCISGWIHFLEICFSFWNVYKLSRDRTAGRVQNRPRAMLRASDSQLHG